MNKCFLIGNLTRDPEVTITNSGLTLCRFSIAVTRRFANAEGEKETDFFNIVAWRSLGELCSKYLHKGSKVAVVGSINNRSYDAQDGTKRTVTEISADEVEFLTTKGSSEEKTEVVADLQPIEDDSLPF